MNPSIDLAIRGKLVVPGRPVARGEVRIRDGVIDAVGDELVGGDEVLDVGDALVLPGAIDAHVHCLSHLDEGIEATTRSAAAGGVTTVIDMPYDADEPMWSVERFERKRGMCEAEGFVDMALLATVHAEDGASDVAPMAEAGACGFKLSIFNTDPYRFPRIQDVDLLDVFRALVPTGLRACVHAENDEIILPLIARAKAAGETDPGAHLRTRPPVSETDGVLKVLEFAHTTSAKVHLCHLSLGRSVDLTRWYRGQGTDVTCETCTHYLTFTEDDLLTKGSTYRINPPMRSSVERDALWAALAEGDIDLVGSDHVGWPRELKTNADIFANKSGAPGIENLVGMTVSQGLNGRKLSPHRLADALAGRPAALFGLADRKGAIAPGLDADLIVWDPSVPHVVDETALHSKAGWSPYHGMSQHGRVSLTLSRGETVWDGSELHGSRGRGRFLAPTRTTSGS